MKILIPLLAFFCLSGQTPGGEPEEESPLVRQYVWQPGMEQPVELPPGWENDPEFRWLITGRLPTVTLTLVN